MESSWNPASGWYWLLHKSRNLVVEAAAAEAALGAEHAPSSVDVSDDLEAGE